MSHRADVCLQRDMMLHNDVCFTAAPLSTVNDMHRQWRQWGLENADGYILLHLPRPQCRPLKLPRECRGVNSWGSSVIGWHTHRHSLWNLTGCWSWSWHRFWQLCGSVLYTFFWKKKVLTSWSSRSFINEEAFGINRSTCSFGILRETHS